MEMLRKWGSFAKLAYLGDSPIGQIQFKPVPEERICSITCVYVPREKNWRKGAGRALLTSLIEEMKQPQGWLDHQPAQALVVRTFPGEKAGQLPARRFFRKMGFQQMGENPDFLCYPLKKEVERQNAEYGKQYVGGREKTEYIPQEADKGKAVLIYGPSFCPFSYPFLKKAEEFIREVAPDIETRWLSKTENVEEMKKRGGFEGIVVNAKPIESFVLDKTGFQKEVKDALHEQ
jgi:N-acetylglutamate synthase-like GNAT family acetyltransferase